MTAELDGYVADAAVTVEAGTRTPAKQRLIRTAAGDPRPRAAGGTGRQPGERGRRRSSGR